MERFNTPGAHNSRASASPSNGNDKVWSPKEFVALSCKVRSKHLHAKEDPTESDKSCRGHHLSSVHVPYQSIHGYLGR